MTEDPKHTVPVDVPPASEKQQESASAEAAAPNTVTENIAHQAITFAGRAGTGSIHTAGQSPDSPPIIEPLPTGASASAEATSPQGSALGAAASTPPSPPLAPPPTKAGMAENSFRMLAYVALPALIIFLALQEFASVYLPSLFLPSEFATASLYEKMLGMGQWLVPPHAESLPAALPVYFWFVALVDAIPYVDGIYMYPLVSAFSALVALTGVYTLALATGLGNRVAFAAGLVLLSTLAFTSLAHFLSPHLFFAGLLAFSMACLYRGWISQQSYGWLAVGFVLAGLCTLTGGLMGLLIPLLTSLCFVIWRGSFRRAHQLDAVFGFALLLVIILGWVGAIILLTNESSYLYTLTRQIFAPFLMPLWPPQDPWWLYLLRLPVALLPWVLVLFFVPWGRVCASAWPTLKASRSTQSGGAWLWIALIIGLLYVTATSSKPCLAFVPLLPLATVLLAKALMNLPQSNSRAFFLGLAFFAAVAALLLAALSLPFISSALAAYVPEKLLLAVENVQGLPVMAAVCALGAVILWKFTRRALPGGALLVTVLLVSTLVQPATMMLAPSLSNVTGAFMPEGVSATSTETAPAAIPPSSTTPSADMEAAPAPVIPEPTALPKAGEAMEAVEGGESGEAAKVEPAPVVDVPTAPVEPEDAPKLAPSAPAVTPAAPAVTPAAPVVTPAE